MAKGDAPPLLMKIKDGRMEPVAQFDYERLCSYRIDRDDQGNIIYPQVKVYITQDAATWRRRKYWAILTKVVEAGPTEYRSPEDLHKAVKREIGFVNSTFLSDGKTLKVTLKSTSKLDEQEFRVFYEEAIEALSEMTGIDVETLGRESADVGRDKTEQPEESSPTSSTSGSEASGVNDRSPDGAAGLDQSASGGPATEEGSDAGATAGEPSSDPRDPKVILNLKAEAVAKFLELATNKDVPDPRDRREVLVKAKEAWKAELPHHHDFLKACVTTADAVIKGQMPADKARQYLEGLVR